MINIKGIDKPLVLAALYNNAKPLGMGMLHYTPEPMEIEEAIALCEQQTRLYFDYVHGRVMKVDLSKDELNPGLYDRDNGPGAAEIALKEAGLI